MQKLDQRWHPENTWIVDLDAGMSWQRVKIAPLGDLPPACEAIIRIVGDKIYIFPHDNMIRFDFGRVCVLDTGSFLFHSMRPK